VVIESALVNTEPWTQKAVFSFDSLLVYCATNALFKREDEVRLK
jgi:hypothetical protein